MSVTIETILSCDDCGNTWSGDDRHLNAKAIRKARKLCGWIQIGRKDYCAPCAKLRKFNSCQPRRNG